jgi:hypothetical protein
LITPAAGAGQFCCTLINAYDTAREHLFESVMNNYPKDGSYDDKIKWAQESANAWIKLEKEQAKQSKEPQQQVQMLEAPRVGRPRVIRSGAAGVANRFRCG